MQASGYRFTFWALVRQSDGTYVAKRHIDLYPEYGVAEVFPLRQDDSRG